MQTNQTENGGHHVIQHDPQTSFDTLIQPAYRPGLQDIEEPKQHKTDNYPDPPARGLDHGAQIADDLVPDDCTRIRSAKCYGCFSANIDAEQEKASDHRQVIREMQIPQHQIQRYADERAAGAGRHGRKAAAEAKRETMSGVSQHSEIRFMYRQCHGNCFV